MRRHFQLIIFLLCLLCWLSARPVFAQTPTVQTTLAAITISGSVKSGTAGVSVPVGLPLSLHVFRLGKSGQPADVNEVITRDLALSGDSYRFEGVSVQSGDLCVVTTTFEGITQGSTPITLADVPTILDLPITLYAGTTDPAKLQISQTQQLISFVSKDVMQVLETVDIQNSGDRFYASAQKAKDGSPISVSLPLPIGARAVAFNTTPTTRFQIGGDLNAPIVQDTKPVFPNQLQKIVFTYQLPYSKGAPIDRDYPYLTNSVQVALPAEAGVVVTAPNFVVTQNTTIDPKRPYMQYTLSTPIKAGGRLIYKLEGAPRNTAAQPAQSLDLGVVLALIGGVIVVGIVGLVIVQRVLSRKAAA